MRLRSYLKVGITSAIILTILLIVCVYSLTTATSKVQNTLRNQNTITETILQLEDVNAYLINEARYYSFTGDEQHLQNYNDMLLDDPFVKASQQFEELGVPKNLTDYLVKVNDASLAAADLETLAFEQIAAGNLQQAQSLLFNAEYKSSVAEVDDLFAVFLNAFNEWSTNTTVQAEKQEQFALIALVISSIAFIVVMIFILSIIAKKLRPLYKLTTNAQMIANGDLMVDTVNVKANDEIGALSSAFNEMVNSLRTLLSTVNQSSMEVAASSEQLLANAEQTNSLSQRVSKSIDTISEESGQQLIQMQENTIALGEVTTGILNVASAAEDVSQSSNDAKEFAMKGQSHISRTIEQMQLIKDSVDETLVTISELSMQSLQIEQFVTAIRDISDQTNLLALNASIEAARAGEAGKGFAVVADEVRKLAEESNLSAQHISEIIRTLQSKVEQTSVQMNFVTRQVEDGVTKVNTSGDSFTQIMDATSNVSDQIISVSAIAQQMSASAEEMTAIFENLQAISKQTADSAKESVTLVDEQDASIHEITVSSNNLARLAEILNQEVAKFKL